MFELVIKNLNFYKKFLSDSPDPARTRPGHRMDPGVFGNLFAVPDPDRWTRTDPEYSEIFLTICV